MSNSISQDSPQSKHCNKCGHDLPLSAFTRDRSRKDGLSAYCRDCDMARRHKYHEDHPDEYKEWYAENRDYKRQYGREYDAKNHDKELARWRRYHETHREEQRKYSQEYHLAHHDELLEKSRLYYVEHREEKLRYNHTWYYANLEKNRQRTREYRAAHREESTRQHYLWAVNNPEKNRAINYRSAARKRDLPADLTADDVRFALSYWDKRCAYCGQPEQSGDAIAFDHFIPLSMGGGSMPENLIPACRYCNSSKHVRDPLVWLPWKFGANRAAEILARIEVYFEAVRSRKGRP